MKLKPMPKTFRKDGFDYRLLRFKRSIAFFEQTNDKGVLAYEIHKVRKIPIPVLFLRAPGYKDYTHYHRLASNNDFGSFGWSYKDKKNATAKFKEMVENDNRIEQKV